VSRLRVKPAREKIPPTIITAAPIHRAIRVPAMTTV
jgi:hypothetical protein